MKEQHVIIITGMHRSGTSLVSNVFQRAGVHIGENLIGPDLGNEQGHFEDVEFFHFHDKVLKRLGQTLFVKRLASLDFITPAETKLALTLIGRRRDRPIWGWKDPRTALFLPFWHSLLPQARYVFVYRHPLEVSLSLLRRGTEREVLASPLIGLHAWQTYNQSILDFYQQHHEICLLGNIRTITADLGSFVRRACQKLALPLQEERLQGLYHPTKLKQASFSPVATDILGKIAPESVTLYHSLEALADLPGPAIDQITAQPDAQLSKLQEYTAEQESVEANHLFQQLLTILEPETVNPIRLSEISKLQQRIDELKQQLQMIESTRAWRLIVKWYAFKQRLKTLTRLT